MMHNKILGKLGEEHAKLYLKKQGYKIIEMNYTNKIGEIDIIARDRDYIVFVEVKTRSNTEFGRPAEAVTHAKQRKIVNVAKMFMVGYPKLSGRFDVIEIIGKRSRGKLDVLELNHIKSAFYRR